ncbi:MAG: PDGLE domain-containing protein [Nitrospirota bacterium]|nr:PDGLE domain-containing protein [Nitrospirota bacterium]
MQTHNKLWFGIGLLALLSPLGILLPSLFNSGGAWGEWGLADLERMVGFAPEGMKHSSDLWNAPMPDYALPGQGTGRLSESLGYLLTGIVGIAVTVAAAYGIAKALAGKSAKEKDVRNGHG